MTVEEALALGFRRLTDAGIEAARLDVRLLLASQLGVSPSDVSLIGDRVLPPEAAAAFETNIARRIAREPASRILGEREFWSLPFRLGPDTLDPRPDSETVVETALAQFGAEPRRVLDLGTGTGCLLLAVLGERPAWTGLGLDIAAGAVAVARVNAAALGLADRARIEAGDWADAEGGFDLILSNPPYIPSGEIEGLEPEVSVFDPRRALDGGPDGLAAYRALAPVILKHLVPGGRAVLEIGQGQADQVVGILSVVGLAEIERRRDYGGIERCLVFTAGSA
jgi:release factor glutamine methyltransferase